MKITPHRPIEAEVEVSEDILERGARVEDLSKLKLKNYFGHISVGKDKHEGIGTLIWLPATTPSDIGVK